MNDQPQWSKEMVALRLRAARRVLGYAEHPHKKKFAKILEVHENTANNWLRGDNYPRAEAIYRLRAYGFDWNFFFEGSLAGVHADFRDKLPEAIQEERDNPSI